VPLEKVVAQLEEQLRLLQVALEMLSYPLLEDKSRTEDLALAGYSSDALTEVVELLKEAIPAASSARQAAKYPIDLDRVRTALVTCQERVAELGKKFGDGLISFGNIEALSALKRRRGQWAKWAETVIRGLQDCEEPLRLAKETILLCWQEIAERAGTTSISVHNKTVGQKIVARSTEPGELVADGLG
jgi:hypothetical protein